MDSPLNRVRNSVKHMLLRNDIWRNNSVILYNFIESMSPNTVSFTSVLLYHVYLSGT
jgi:hypothetical protein